MPPSLEHERPGSYEGYWAECETWGSGFPLYSTAGIWTGMNAPGGETVIESIINSWQGWLAELLFTPGSYGSTTILPSPQVWNLGITSNSCFFCISYIYTILTPHLFYQFLPLSSCRLHLQADVSSCEDHCSFMGSICLQMSPVFTPHTLFCMQKLEIPHESPSTWITKKPLSSYCLEIRPKFLHLTFRTF